MLATVIPRLAGLQVVRVTHLEQQEQDVRAPASMLVHSKDQTSRVAESAWGVVLGAGDGTRLATLTKDKYGTSVPKQFCSLNGGRSLLQETRRRARRLVPAKRVCAIVARRHAPLWRRALRGMQNENIIVQPLNRGTGNGVLLATLCIMARDPDAKIIFLPSDHYVHQEEAFADSLQTGLLQGLDGELLLIGVQPDAADPDLGYIMPEAGHRLGVRPVARFVEKPSARVARELIQRGALWNTFIFAARASTLVEIFSRRVPAIVQNMRQALRATRHPVSYPGAGVGALDDLYATLPVIDFSRDVLSSMERHLRVLAVPSCGWTDLGTPTRVLAALSRFGERKQPVGVRLPRTPSLFEYADAQRRRCESQDAI